MVALTGGAPRRPGRSGRAGHVEPSEAGEPGEFDVRRAWDAHGAALFGFAVNALSDRGAAEDCVQETFVRAWRARAQFSERRGSERTWLFAIARNAIVDAHRARARRPVPVDDDGVARLAAVEPGQQGQVVDRIALLEALAQVSAEHREVVVAVQLEQLTYQQLADRTGVPVATLRTRMYYGLRALREALGEEAHDDRDR